MCSGVGNRGVCIQVLVIYHGELVHCDQALYCYVIRVLDGSRAGLVLTGIPSAYCCCPPTTLLQHPTSLLMAKSPNKILHARKSGCPLTPVLGYRNSRTMGCRMCTSSVWSLQVLACLPFAPQCVFKHLHLRLLGFAGAAVQSRPDAGQFDVWPAYQNEPLRL